MICPHPWKNIFVTITGDVYPCCFNTVLKSFGNIKEKGILDIWHGKEYEELRQAWADGTWRDVGCDGCRLLSLSRGGITYPDSGVQNPESAAWKNHLVNEEEFAQRRATIRSLPETLTYFPSTHCNLNCVFCGQNTSGVLDLGDVGYEMLRTVSPTLRAVTWLGGEPVIQPQLSRWLEDLDSFANPEIQVGIITNGSFFAEKLAAQAAKYSWLSVNISFDAHQKELYESLRRKGSFPATLATIDRYRALREASDRFSVNVNFLWQKANFATLPAYLRFCRERELFALVNPLDFWPVPMRLDFFADLGQDLPADYEAVLEESLAEARALDEALERNPRARLVEFSMGMPARVLPYVELCVDLMRAGVARHRENDAVWEGSLGDGYLDHLVIGHSPDGTVVSYAPVDAAGRFRLRYKSGGGVVFTLYKDSYGTQTQVFAKDLVEFARGKRLAIWGTGQSYLDSLAPLVRSGALGDSLRCFLDNSPDKQGQELDGYPILAPGVLHQGGIDAVFIISCKSGEIIAQIQKMPLEVPLFVSGIRLRPMAAWPAAK